MCVDCVRVCYVCNVAEPAFVSDNEADADADSAGISCYTPHTYARHRSAIKYLLMCSSQRRQHIRRTRDALPRFMWCTRESFMAVHRTRILTTYCCRCNVCCGLAALRRTAAAVHIFPIDDSNNNAAVAASKRAYHKNVYSNAPPNRPPDTRRMHRDISDKTDCVFVCYCLEELAVTACGGQGKPILKNFQNSPNCAVCKLRHRGM